MNKIFGLAIFAAAALGVAISASAPAQAQGGGTLLEGKAAFTDWHADRPGLVRHIKPADIPAANLAGSSSNGVRIVRRTANDKPVVPPGSGLFTQEGQLLVWVTADARRIPVRVRSKVPVGSVSGDLESYTPPGGS